MKTILCFGDSNTFGFNPADGSRFSENERWSGILKNHLASYFKVIEAGCNNRTCFSDNSAGEIYTGYKAIKKYLSQNIDIIILQIGINDLQSVYNSQYSDILNGLDNFISQIKAVKPDIKIILMCPSVIKNNILKSNFYSIFNETSIEKSILYKEIYEKISEKHACFLFNLSDFSQVSDIDSLHYESGEHTKIALALQKILLNNDFMS